MRTELYDWVDQWWYLASEWLHDPYPLKEPKWDNLRYRAGVLPDEIDGVCIKPLRKLFKAMLAYGSAPSIINGPALSQERLQEVASDAWDTYQRLHAVRLSPRAKNSTVYGIAELKEIIDAEDNETARKYAEAAGLPVAKGRGARIKYTHAEAVNYALHVMQNFTMNSHRDAARNWLESLRRD